MIKNLSENQEKENPLFDENLLENGLIGGLAKELAEDINLNDLNLNLTENSENINDVFSNLLSGDNPMNFMNLIQNVGQKIQTKLENADLDQDKLMKEAQTDDERKMYDSLQYATKSLVASMYGVAGDAKYGMYHPDIAAGGQPPSPQRAPSDTETIQS